MKNESASVKRFHLGAPPVPTETVVEHIPEQPIAEMPLGTLTREAGPICWRIPLGADAVVYGLGQRVRGMNKRGFRYRSFCSDDPSHTPDKEALYGAHDFWVVWDAGKWYGAFVDTPGAIQYDVGFEVRDRMTVVVTHGCGDLYYFEGSFEGIVRRYRQLIGKAYAPPKWAFGYQQSRWGYVNEADIRAVQSGFDAHDIPLDAIYMDIDYMERYKDFTVDAHRFPDLPGLAGALKAEGIRLIPIIDAGVKIEPGYSIYEEGLERQAFCTDASGKPFVAAVWPGRVHFPDFLNPEAAEWFGDQYAWLMDQGIEGFWNDMNEPAIFYSESGLETALEYLCRQRGENLDIHGFFKLKDTILGLANSPEDYQALHHRLPNGTRISHEAVHNLYGYKMSRAAAEGILRKNPGMRPFLITRASHAGLAKHTGIWTGDNQSLWEHLLLNIQMMPALGMMGFLYAGADVGGFGGHASAELMVRWMQFAVFTPLFRNHSALGTRPQEPWAFDALSLAQMRSAIRLRYAFLPYLYSAFMQSVLKDALLMAPLSYAYTDAASLRIEDQLLFGEDVMLAPVYVQNARGRAVYLPEPMAFFPMTDYEHLEADFMDKARILDAGHHYIEVPEDTIPLFIRPDHIICFAPPANRTAAMASPEALTVFGYVRTQATHALYDDDGVSLAYQDSDSEGAHHTVIHVALEGEALSLSVDTYNARLQTVCVLNIEDSGKITTCIQSHPRTQVHMV